MMINAIKCCDGCNKPAFGRGVSLKKNPTKTLFSHSKGDSFRFNSVEPKKPSDPPTRPVDPDPDPDPRDLPAPPGPIDIPVW